jgi:hypothetical protein
MHHRNTIFVGICLVLFGVIQVMAQRDDIDWNRARQLRQRSLQGEKLTEEEQSYEQETTVRSSDKAMGLLARSGWSVDDVPYLDELTGLNGWQVHCHRGEQLVIVRAKTQDAAWIEAVRLVEEFGERLQSSGV